MEGTKTKELSKGIYVFDNIVNINQGLSDKVTADANTGYYHGSYYRVVKAIGKTVRGLSVPAKEFRYHSLESEDARNGAGPNYDFTDVDADGFIDSTGDGSSYGINVAFDVKTYRTRTRQEFNLVKNLLISRQRRYFARLLRTLNSRITSNDGDITVHDTRIIHKISNYNRALDNAILSNI